MEKLVKKNLNNVISKQTLFHVTPNPKACKP